MFGMFFPDTVYYITCHMLESKVTKEENTLAETAVF